jgi:FAD/FMN-containing dehydrogenase
MNSKLKLPAFSEGCEASAPDPSADIDQYVSRWSKTGIQSIPAVIIVPAIEQDIVNAIAFARENGLKLIPAGGTHGPSVPINSHSVYMDMRQFKNIQLDEYAGTVTIGGGVITGNVLRTLEAQGFYTSK